MRKQILRRRALSRWLKRTSLLAAGAATLLAPSSSQAQTIEVVSVNPSLIGPPLPPGAVLISERVITEVEAAAPTETLVAAQPPTPPVQLRVEVKTDEAEATEDKPRRVQIQRVIQQEQRSDRPQSDRSQNNRPQTDRPQFDRPAPPRPGQPPFAPPQPGRGSRPAANDVQSGGPLWDKLFQLEKEKLRAEMRAELAEEKASFYRELLQRFMGPEGHGPRPHDEDMHRREQDERRLHEEEMHRQHEAEMRREQEERRHREEEMHRREQEERRQQEERMQRDREEELRRNQGQRQEEERRMAEEHERRAQQAEQLHRQHAELREQLEHRERELIQRDEIIKKLKQAMEEMLNKNRQSEEKEKTAEGKRRKKD